MDSPKKAAHQRLADLEAKLLAIQSDTTRRPDEKSAFLEHWLRLDVIDAVRDELAAADELYRTEGKSCHLRSHDGVAKRHDALLTAIQNAIEAQDSRHLRDLEKRETSRDLYRTAATVESIRDPAFVAGYAALGATPMSEGFF